MGNGNKPLPQNISYSCLKVCWQVSKCSDWKLQTSKHTCTQDLFPVPSPVHPVLQIEVVSGSCAIQVSEETLPHPQATETAGPLSGQAWGCTVWTLPVSMDTTSLQCPDSRHYQSPMPKLWTLPVSNSRHPNVHTGSWGHNIFRPYLYKQFCLLHSPSALLLMYCYTWNKFTLNQLFGRVNGEQT